MEWRVSLQDGEHLRVFAAAVLWDPAFANGEFMVAEHVHHTNGGEGHGEEVWPLRHGCPYEQATVGASSDAQFVLVRVTFRD